MALLAIYVLSFRPACSLADSDFPRYLRAVAYIYRPIVDAANACPPPIRALIEDFSGANRIGMSNLNLLAAICYDPVSQEWLKFLEDNASTYYHYHNE